MLSFPNVKINLGLNIVSKRRDGYHNIESCFYPVPWCDVLEIIRSGTFEFTSSGLIIPGAQASNLCISAYQLLRDQYKIGPVRIHLHKVIPVGAGLGGGSSDGAFTIKMLSNLFGLNLSESVMETLAGILGSDCPFFIKNKPVFAKGTGSEFHPVEIDLTGKYIALKHPGIHVSTKEAYSAMRPEKPEIPIPVILNHPHNDWKGLLKNDFEKFVFPNHSPIQELKEQLYKKGALYASMSGSGSAVYGIFDNKPDLPGFEVFDL